MRHLRILRRERGLTQEELARELSGKFSSAMIRRYERGLSEPSLTSLIIMAEYFDVSIDYLVGHSDYRNKVEKVYEITDLNADEVGLLGDYRELKKHSRCLIRCIIEEIIMRDKHL